MPGFLRSRWFWIITVLVVVIVGGFFFVKGQAAEKKKKTEAAAKMIAPSPFAAIASGKADIEGGIIQVAARRGGVVKSVYVEEGQSVVAGQILARQEDDEPRLAVARARAQVAQAESQIGVMQVKLTAARREYGRLENLSASNYVAKQRLDQQMDEIRDWEAQIVAQRASIATSRAALGEAEYALELTVIRAPIDGRIARRYANPGAGASTLNVSTMFDLEPNTARIVRAEIVEADIPNVTDDQEVEIQPESDPDKTYLGKVLRRAGVFGARKLASDDPSQRSDDRVIEVVVSAGDAPLLVGQRVLVKFMKPGFKAGAKRIAPKIAVPAKS
jgi:RND family efflux transporter MFP subunit